MWSDEVENGWNCELRRIFPGKMLQELASFFHFSFLLLQLNSWSPRGLWSMRKMWDKIDCYFSNRFFVKCVLYDLGTNSLSAQFPIGWKWQEKNSRGTEIGNTPCIFLIPPKSNSNWVRKDSTKVCPCITGFKKTLQCTSRLPYLVFIVTGCM